MGHISTAQESTICHFLKLKLDILYIVHVCPESYYYVKLISESIDKYFIHQKLGLAPRYIPLGNYALFTAITFIYLALVSFISALINLYR
jgi:hypothetical protein